MTGGRLGGLHRTSGKGDLLSLSNYSGRYKGRKGSAAKLGKGMGRISVRFTNNGQMQFQQPQPAPVVLRLQKSRAPKYLQESTLVSDQLTWNDLKHKGAMDDDFSDYSWYNEMSTETLYLFDALRQEQ